MCALILWRSGLGLVMSKFCQFVTELSAQDMIMAGYYCFTFFFIFTITLLFLFLPENSVLVWRNKNKIFT